MTVINTGDLAGSYEVIIERGKKMIDSITITLAGQDSQEVRFSTTASYAAGNYSISVNGLSGTLTVRKPTHTPPASKNTGTSTGRATS